MWLAVWAFLTLFGYTSTSTLNYQWVTETPVPLSSAPAPPLRHSAPTVPANITAQPPINTTTQILPTNETLFKPLNSSSAVPATTDGEDEYYSSYQDYPEPINSSGALVPSPEEEEIQLPSDSLADTDLHDHDLIDSVMYIYFGGAREGRPGSLPLSPSQATQPPHNLQVVIVGAVISLVAQFLSLASGLKRIKRGDSSLAVLLNTELSLTLTNLLFMLGVQATSDPWTCETIAIGLHYLHLVTAGWFSASSYHSFRRLQPTYKPSLLLYSLFVWITPVPAVYVFAVLNKGGYETRSYCWMSVEKGLLFSFVLPICFLIAINTILTIWGLKRSSSKEPEVDRKAVRLSASLLPMFAIVWLLSVLALDKTESLLFPLLYVATNAFLNWFVYIWWLPGDDGGWRGGESQDDDYEDDYDEELLYEEPSTKDDTALLTDQQLIYQREVYDLQMEPISTISS